MNSKEIKTIREAYLGIYEQIKVPSDASDEEVLKGLIPKGEKVREVPKPKKVTAAEEVDIYDIILSSLLDEGYTEEESNQIMVLIIENQMSPPEVFGRGLANMLGFDRPHPTQVFGRAFKAAFMNKPQTVQAPKPQNPPRVSPVGKPPSGKKPSTTPSKPNPYRPGATVRATGPNMDKFPELQRFANQGTRIAPTPKPKSGQGLSIPGGRLGAFAAGIQAYNTADATPKTAPKFPTTPKEVKKGETYYDPSTRVGSSQRFAQRQKVGPKIVGPKLSDAQHFDNAYAIAKQKGGMGSTFSWRGKSYKVS